MVLMVTLTLMLILVGSFVGRKTGMMFALIIAVGMNFVAYWFSDKIVLRMYGARQVSEAEEQELFSIMDVNPATSHMFIVNPLSGRCLLRLFSTHSPMKERITRLESLRAIA